ncbi:MAG: response regulator transcription factor, partial [Planctomycetaceae bacterium]|nr:response regulator transcription factor [Planctomycetaceae bacterium]
MTAAAKGDGIYIKTRARIPVRIAVVDDHDLLRWGVTRLIEQQPGWEVCSEARDLAGALRVVEKHENLDLMICNLRSAKTSGFLLIQRLKEASPNARILVYAAADESLYAERLVRAGAMGYVKKDQPPEQLIRAIRTVLEGRIYLSSLMTDLLVTRTAGKSERNG